MSEHNFPDFDDDQIADYYDHHPDVTLADLARMTRRSVYELKKILMPE